jgi:hypothetical protein
MQQKQLATYCLDSHMLANGQIALLMTMSKKLGEVKCNDRFSAECTFYVGDDGVRREVARRQGSRLDVYDSRLNKCVAGFARQQSPVLS